MDDIDQKMDLHTIDRHITEFVSLSANMSRGRGQRSSRMRFIAKGAYLSGLRDSIEPRLSNGWASIDQNPDNVELAEFWFGLLERYELINDMLAQHADDSMREEFASFVFKGERENANAATGGPANAR